jgi:hypothetical protein
LLKSLPRQAESLVDHEEPSATRLFPVAYPGDEAAQSDYRDLMGAQLVERHRHVLDALASTVDAETLDLEQLQEWLAAVEVLRLLLGTQLDVSEDMVDVDRDDPRSTQFGVYQYLSMLQSEIVDALAGALPRKGMRADDLGPSDA